MTNTMTFQTTTTTLDLDTLVSTPHEVGQWMADAAISEWYNHNEGNFSHHRKERGADTFYTVTDSDEEKKISFTAVDFFRKHVELIWLAQIENYRHDWIDFAFKSKGATADEYDANTCDAVLQNMLYGEVIYG